MAISVALRKRHTRGGRARRGTMAPLRGLLPLAMLLALWQILGDEQSPTLPPPSTWIDALGRLNEQGVLSPALGHTGSVLAMAITAAAIVGTVLGVVLGSARGASRAMSPFLEFMRALPPPTLVPIAVLLMGPTLGMSITVIVLGSVWPILFNVMAARQAVPSVRVEMSQSMGLTRWQRLVKIVLPGMVPGIALGIRVAVPICLILTLVTEMLASTGGVGQLLLQQQRSFDSAAVFGLLAMIGLAGYLINAIVAAVEQQLLRNWPPQG